MLGDTELSLLIVSYDLPGTLCIGASFIGFFSPWQTLPGPARILQVSDQSHGLRGRCSSCSFSSEGNAAGREGWQFSGSIPDSSAAPSECPALFLEGEWGNHSCVQVQALFLGGSISW